MDLKKICYFAITGASRGIGKTLAIECCKNFLPGSVAVLMARSKEGLNETKKEIQAINDKISVVTSPIDVSQTTADGFHKIIIDSLADRNINEFQLAFIIHNVGSIGDVSKRAKEISDYSTWTSYFQLNVFSVAALNSVFMKHFANVFKIIVNITSKSAIAPFKSFTLYCSGKAARELYFRVLAEEESECVVLNYSPGPVDTDMVMEVQSKSVDADIREYFKQQKDTGSILVPLQTVTKFLQILKEFKFKSGDHIDYYD